MTLAIAGVTGNTGKAAATALLERGQKVRVIVRDAAKGAPWKDKGAEVAVADLGDPKALTRALQGAKGAWLLIPPNMAVKEFRAYQDRITQSFVSAIQESRIPHVAFLSSIGAQQPSRTGPITGLHYAEEALTKINATRFSFIRAAYFIENTGGSLGMLDKGLLPSFVPASFVFDMVAAADIGSLAASVLEHGTSKTEVIELASGRYSMNDIAATLSTLAGKTIRVQEAPLDAMVPTLTGFGVPQEVAELYREMTEAIIDGRVAFEGTHRHVQGKTSLKEALGKLLKP